MKCDSSLLHNHYDESSECNERFIRSEPANDIYVFFLFVFAHLFEQAFFLVVDLTRDLMQWHIVIN